ncbi:MAG TPA: Asp-tRNA(Asn)/Glu-tRNA(Gln) amidotransferase subunit GatA [Saprospiraceae bacterium]|nr:Asp-tRNA(Asn)/Glu-tRNA(Gln) amidotransferase subunit GatA [Saprospiraceae bacterium]
MTHITIEQLHEDVKSGKTSFEAQVRNNLAQINQNGHLNAFVNVFGEEAIESAQMLDNKIKNGEPLGALAGVVVSIKDNICYKNHLATAGSKILTGYRSPFSATAVEKLLAADAIIIGTTNCDQFGMGSMSTNSHYGAVRNGFDSDLIAGGSSGGAAVSVQAGMCMVALGSDTGGSVRQPAAFTGTIGFKPTYGSVSRYGLIAYGSSFDQIGIISSNYEDASLVYDVIAGKDVNDATSIEVSQEREIPSGRLKLAYVPEMFAGQSDWMEENRQYLEVLGRDHDLMPVSFDYMKYLVPCYYILCTAEASSNLSRFDGVRYGHRSEKKGDLLEMYKNSRSEGFGSEVKKRIMLGTFVLSEGYFDAYFTKALKVRRLLADRINNILSEADGFVLPVSAVGPWRLDEKITDPTQLYMSDIYTVLANLVGNPCITVPISDKKHNSTSNNSLQLIVKSTADRTIFNLAKLISIKY